MKANTKIARLFSILLALAMMVSMLPTVALAEEATTPTTPTTTEPTSETTTTTTPETTTPAPAPAAALASAPAPASVTTTASTAADFSANPTAALVLLNRAKTEGAADSEWNSTSNTLTLNGVNFVTSAAIAVILPDDAIIDLNGDNTITSVVASSEDSFGICALGDLTIRGAGKLDVTGGTATDDNKNSHGIYTVGSLTISNGTVTATGGTATKGSSYGIYSDDKIEISGSTTRVTATGGTATGASIGIDSEYNNYPDLSACSIMISGGTVTAKGGAAGSYSYGINVPYNTMSISGGTVNATGGDTSRANSFGIYSGIILAISGDADVTAKGGTAASSSSYGLLVSKVTISDTAKVKATGGTATYSYGINSQRTIDISGGKVEATGVEASFISYGICATTGLTISGDNTVVTATGGTASNNSKGIYVKSNLTIGSGKVEATGGKAGVGSYGIEAFDNIEISGGTVTAKGDEVTRGSFTYSYGIYSNNKVTISNTATVTAEGGKTKNSSDTYSYGIQASNGLSISGGAVTAKAGTAKTAASAFDKSPSISSSLNYWWRTSASGAYTANSENGYAWDSAHIYVEIRNTEPAAATTYTVSFDANGGSGTMADVSGVSGNYPLPANGFTAPAGKQFKGWATSSDGTVISGTSITVTADTPLYAIWEAIPGSGTTGGTTPTRTPSTKTENYRILDGAGSAWTQNTDGSLSIRGNGAFSKFVGVKIDGKPVDKKHYTVKEGSTIVTLKTEYLSTLAAGRHDIQLMWKDGTASTTFNINVNNPNTGDTDGLALAAALLALSAAAIATSGFHRKRGKSSR